MGKPSDADVVETFLRAARSGDLDAVVAVLAPDVVRRADAAALPAGAAPELRGAGPVAAGTVLLAALHLSLPPDRRSTAGRREEGGATGPRPR